LTDIWNRINIIEHRELDSNKQSVVLSPLLNYRNRK